MIELRALPLRGGVAGLASGGESGIAVIRTGSRVVRVAMAGGAVLRSACELVIHVALLATGAGVLAGERVFRRCVVIEAGAAPLRGGVARLARCGETGSHVIGVYCVLEPRQMATGAILRGACELIVQVALLAGHRVVLAGEGEARAGVIENRAFPLARGMAHCAVGGESRRFVVRIDRGVVGGKVATGAIVGDAAELVVDVALSACRGRVPAGERELGFRVVEGGALPAGRGVTGFALCGERRRCMVGILRRLKLLEVAGGAILREVLEHVPGMALHTSRGGVLAGERELCVDGMIELRTAPLDAGVAQSAVFGKARGNVVGVVGWLLEIGAMATDTRSSDAGVLVVDMARLATYRGVLAGERELRSVVIEQAVGPERSIVAGLASRSEACGSVVRVLGVAKFRQVAAGAILSRAFELVAQMALHATGGDVPSGEGIFRRGVVIEARALPLHRGVAQGAVLRDSGGYVVGIVRWLAEVGLVAADAGLGRAAKAVIDVTLQAGCDDMLAGERETGLSVIEGAPFPLQRRMAGLTGSSESGRGVIGCFRIAVLIQMACGAILAKPGVTFVDVALLASERRVLAGQWEFRSGIVIELRAFPLHRGVTHRAVGGEARLDMVWIDCFLQLIAMAGEAVLGHAGKLVIRVALGAGHSRVLAG